MKNTRTSRTDPALMRPSPRDWAFIGANALMPFLLACLLLAT